MLSYVMIEQTPKISIITVVYNSVSYIEETIKHVLNQTYSNIEYIIIDGGSTDGTVKRIEQFKDQLAYFISEKDEGIYEAMNKGIVASTGDWINFVNAGDKYVNENVISNIFHNKNVEVAKFDVIYGNSIVIDKNHIRRLINAGSSPNDQWKGPIFRHGAMFTKAKLHKKYLFNLNPEYRICADFDFIYKLYIKGYLFKKVNINILYFLQEGVSFNRIRCTMDNKMVVLSYTPKMEYRIWHNIQIVRAWIITKLISPILHY